MMIGQSALSGLTMHRAVVYRKKVYTYGIGHQLQEINNFYVDTVSSFPPSTGT